ncbi:MAG TPA: hypothetical protein VK250_04895 [Nitrososphaeraceae archaeon]|nr:hypothetical protein [Nitrososphaeraceae archaeon]
MLNLLVILTLVAITIIPIANSFAQSLDTIEINSTLKKGNLIDSYLYFQNTNMTLGEGNKICPEINCLYEFEKTSFDNLFGDNSRTFSGTLKIEDKTNSTGDSILYKYYKLSGSFDLINSTDNPETEDKIFVYKGDLGFDVDKDTFGKPDIKYESEVKLYQPQNKLELIGQVKK